MAAGKKYITNNLLPIWSANFQVLPSLSFAANTGAGSPVVGGSFSECLVVQCEIATKQRIKTNVFFQKTWIIFPSSFSCHTIFFESRERYYYVKFYKMNIRIILYLFITSPGRFTHLRSNYIVIRSNCSCRL